MYKIVLTRQAEKDAAKLEQTGLKAKAAFLLQIIKQNPKSPLPPHHVGIPAFA
jgi:mRNA-degrading endonuclease RelE of RelBE toxin-antitoxin system